MAGIDGVGAGLRRGIHQSFASPRPVSEATKRMLPMNVSGVPATVVVKPPEVPVFKAPDRTPDVQNGAAADGTRTPQPTLIAPLPPGQGTRIDQLA
ncbi:hypothetical protein CQ10_01385 [Bradyrhizobium valentinum]|nr:hypothetical protein CQ10_01385 [Bradyrhizobium valentinum]